MRRRDAWRRRTRHAADHPGRRQRDFRGNRPASPVAALSARLVNRPVVTPATAYNIGDMRLQARRRLPRGLFDFIDRGSEDDVALRNNESAFRRIKLRPRVLKDVSERRQDIEFFGRRQSSPLGIAPTGPAAHMWYDGELALARAASRFQIPLVLSNAAATPMEQVVSKGGTGPKWFQLYMTGDRPRSIQTVHRARQAGFETLVLTVDSVFAANREFVLRSGYTVPFRLNPLLALDVALHPRWLVGTLGRYLMGGGLPLMVNYPVGDTRNPAASGVKMKDDSMTWETVRMLRDLWPGKFVIKGIVDPRDATAAAAAGVDGIIVSNHGAVMLDSSMATIDALPDVVKAVDGRLPIFLDGGVRRGSDVVKALALGARAVFVGRATLYALAAFGEEGVVRALEILRDEIDNTLAALGCSSIDALTREHVVLPTDGPFRPMSAGVE